MLNQNLLKAMPFFMGPVGPPPVPALAPGVARFVSPPPANWQFGVRESTPQAIGWDGTTMYFNGSQEALHTLDTKTGIATRVGSATNYGRNLRAIRSIAGDGTNLYMASNVGRGLFTVDQTTGIATQVGSSRDFGVGETKPTGLAWDGTNLYMVGRTQNALYTVNRTTGIATRVGNATQFGVNTSQVSGIEWDGTNLYMVEAQSDILFTLDRTTGVATRVGNATQFGVNERHPEDIAWDGTNLYMIGSDNDALYILDRTTGLVTSTITQQWPAYNFGTGKVLSISALTSDGIDVWMIDHPRGQLYTVNVETSIATARSIATKNLFGELQPMTTVESMAFLNGVLYAFEGGIFYSINTTTGLASIIGFAFSYRNVTGLTAHNNQLYMADYATNALYTVSTTGTVTRVGSATNWGVSSGATPRPAGLASHNGTLYMVSSFQSGLWTVNDSTGIASRVDSDVSNFGVNETQASGLVSYNDKLYMSTGDTRVSSLYEVGV